MSAATQKVLDESHSRLIQQVDKVGETIAFLASNLREIRQSEGRALWELTIEQCRLHPICALLHQDPLTERAFKKPRGYQGDAELLDIIYNSDWRLGGKKDVTSLGKAIFEYTISCKAPSAVRIRRDMLSRMIDETCERIDAPHILSVACGHLREAGLSQSVRVGRVGRFVGLDQDPLSLEIVENDLAGCNVEAICGSIKLLLKGPLTQQRFDFIYAAGLYDYLEERLSQRLTKKMFEMLNPNGRLLVANYLPNIEDVGYMEAYEDWRLIYRDAPTMEQLADEIPKSSISELKIYNDISNTIVFLQLDRK